MEEASDGSDQLGGISDLVNMMDIDASDDRTTGTAVVPLHGRCPLGEVPLFLLSR